MILLEEEIYTAGHYRLIKREIVGAPSRIEEDEKENDGDRNEIIKKNNT